MDLTGLKAPASGTGTATLRVHDVFGPILVVLPSQDKLSYTINIRAHTAFGPVSLDGQGDRGGGMFTTKTQTYGTGRAVLNLQLVDAFGPITVNVGAVPSGKVLSPSPPPKP